MSLFFGSLKRSFNLNVYRRVFLVNNSYRKERFPVVVINIATSSISFCILYLFDKVYDAHSVINESQIKSHLFGSNARDCFA